MMIQRCNNDTNVSVYGAVIMTIGIARIHRDECAFNIRQPPTFRQNQLTLATILPVGCYQSQSYRLKTWHPYRLKTWHQRHGPGFVILLFF